MLQKLTLKRVFEIKHVVRIDSSENKLRYLNTHIDGNSQKHMFTFPS